MSILEAILQALIQGFTEFLPVSIFVREIEDPQKISGVVFINGISAGRDADRLFYELQLILVLLIKAIYAVNEKNAAWCKA